MIIKKTEDLIKNLSKKNKINFIPTMGNLHRGHINLLKIAKRKNHFSLVSIFVNPLQFNDKDDFINYPRTIDSDLKILEKNNADIIFLPQKNFLNNLDTSVQISNLSKKLCGLDRPGHFSGVAIIMKKFLNIIKPSFLTLGEKDFQQVLVIKKLINDIFLHTKIILSPTIRDKDGVAMSSRNNLISKDKKKLLPMIFKILNFISNKITQSGLSEKELEFIKAKFLKAGFERVNYLDILKEKTLCDLNESPANARIFISVTIDGVRLIDNYQVIGRLIRKENLIKKVSS